MCWIFWPTGAEDQVKAWMGGPADVVLSDMAAASSGHKGTDHLRIIALVEAALEFAFDVLEEGGTFVAKVLAGGAENEMQTLLKRSFTKVANVKPPASRSDSSEKFVVAMGFRGRRAPDSKRVSGRRLIVSASTTIQAAQKRKSAPEKGACISKPLAILPRKTRLSRPSCAPDRNPYAQSSDRE